MMWWNHGGWGAGDWTLMIVMMVIFWGLVAAAIMWSVQGRRTSSERPQRPTPTADELLDQRFARGEIDTDEYAKRQSALHQPLQSPRPRGRAADSNTRP